MRTTTTLRIMAAALLTGGTFAVAAAGTSAAAADQGGPAQSAVVQLAPDSSQTGGFDCRVRGDRFDGNQFWYWLVGPDGRVVAVFVDTGSRHIPDCDRSWSNWDPSWDRFNTWDGSF